MTEIRSNYDNDKDKSREAWRKENFHFRLSIQYVKFLLKGIVFAIVPLMYK
jgi:hypothetical protein